MRRSLRQAISKLWAGDDPKAILDEGGQQWDAITEQIGVDKQKAVYAKLGRQVRRLSEVRPRPFGRSPYPPSPFSPASGGEGGRRPDEGVPLPTSITPREVWMTSHL